jgi:signal transduction histidine kinase
MKKFILLMVIGLVTWISLAWNNVTAHPNWYHAMMIIGGIIALAVVAVLLKVIIKLVKWMVTSPTYLFLATVSIGLLTGFSVIRVGYGILICVGLSVLFTVAIIRHFALNNNGIFLWLTGYKIQAVVSKGKPVKQVKEDSEIEKYLEKLGYNKQERQEASEYALEEKPNEGIEEQVKCALGYLGQN